MKKLLLTLLTGCFILSGCQKAPASESSGMNQPTTPSVSASVAAESTPSVPKSFLESHSERELEELFAMIGLASLPNLPDATDPFPYYGFEDTSKLSSNGLFNFFQAYCDQTEAETYWEESDQNYHIPLAFVKKTLDRYFAGYTFSPEEITYQSGYQPENQAFVRLGIVNFGGGLGGIKITSAEQTADGKIRIEGNPLNLDSPAKETGARKILVLQPTEENFQFVSYQIIPAE